MQRLLTSLFHAAPQYDQARRPEIWGESTGLKNCPCIFKNGGREQKVQFTTLKFRQGCVQPSVTNQ
jgi:hypothetical protein